MDDMAAHSSIGIIEPSVPDVETVLTDPAASHWLKVVLQSALTRDSVDAANDAEVLAAILRDRAQQQFERLTQGSPNGGEERDGPALRQHSASR